MGARPALFLLCFLLPCGAFGQAGTADALLTEAAALLAKAKRGGGLEDILKDARLKRWDGYRIRYAAEAYYLCKAVAGGGDASCAALAPLCKDGCRDDGPFHSPVELCRSFYGRVRLSKALITHDPSALELCLRKGPDMGERQVSEWQRKGLCEMVLTQGEKDQAGTCAKSVDANYSVAAPTTKSCDKGLHDYWGLSDPCDPEAALPPPPTPASGGSHESMTCLCADASADFRRARAADDIERCGPDPLCRAMMGGGAKACAPYARRLVAAGGQALMFGAKQGLDAADPGQTARYDALRAQWDLFDQR